MFHHWIKCIEKGYYAEKYLLYKMFFIQLCLSMNLCGKTNICFVKTVSSSLGYEVINVSNLNVYKHNQV